MTIDLLRHSESMTYSGFGLSVQAKIVFHKVYERISLRAARANRPGSRSKVTLDCRDRGNRNCSRI